MDTSQGATGIMMDTIQGSDSTRTSTIAASAHIKSHNVTQFCPMEGCTYSSYPTRDPSMLSACLNPIMMYMKYTHDIGMSEPSGGGTNNVTP